MVRGIANSKIGFGDLILLLRYFFKLKVSTHPNDFYEVEDKFTLGYGEIFDNQLIPNTQKKSFFHKFLFWK